MQRREFLKLAGLSTAAAAASTRTALGAAAAPEDPRGRTYASGKHLLELNGVTAGVLRGYSGGGVFGTVVTEGVAPDGVQRKHLAGLKYEPIVVRCGTGMSRAFYDAIRALSQRKYTRYNGAIVSCDYNGQPMTRLEFANALVTGLTMPGLDAASKDPAEMDVTITPESIRVVRAKGSANQSDKFAAAPNLQKKWLPANFRLQIDQCDNACARASKVDELALVAKVAEQTVGEQRDSRKVPGALVVPDLVVTLPDSQADPFYQWFEDFVVRGNNTQERERSGTLEYVTPNLRETLFSLAFKNLGIYSIVPDKTEGDTETIRRVRVSMYCEDITFDYKAAWA